MTTPSVSINKILWNDDTQVGFFADYGRGAFKKSFNTKSMMRWVGESRPKSVSRAQSASGWRNPTAWSHRGWFVHDLQMTFVYSSSAGGAPKHYVSGYIDMGGSGSRIDLLSIDGNAEGAAINQALSALKDQKVNLSVAFGERKEAGNMMVDRVVSIAKSIRNFRHRRPKDWVQVVKNGTRNQLRNIPNSWLELQYGWKPLMSDVHGACEALNRKERDNDAYRAHVKGRRTFKGTRQVTRDTGYGGFQRVFVEDSWSVKVDMYYFLDNPFIATLAQLGITNPAELVWELVPYSFVIDWFIPVGNYLSLLDADFGWSFRSGTVSRMQRLAARGGEGQTKPNKYSFVILSKPFFQREYSLNRRVLTSSPWPSAPSLKNPLSSGHIANAMSLLVSSFK